MCPAGGTQQLNFLVATDQSLEGKRQTLNLSHVHVETQIFKLIMVIVQREAAAGL